jgi:thymidylate synthase
MLVIEADSADEVWQSAAGLIDRREGVIRQSGRAGDTLELLHACLVVRSPTERWVLNRRPAINPAFALAEVVWILSGRDDSGFLNFWNPVLPRFAGRGPLYYGAYGQRLRYRFGIDQIRFAYETLRAQPASRQVVLQIWDAASDLPIEAGQPRSGDIPCNVCSLLKIRNGRLDWTQVMRSNDLVLGWPHNVVQFTTLQEMMAAWLEVEPGCYTHFSDSLHVYSDQLPDLKELTPVTPVRNSDRWSLPYPRTMEVIEDLGMRMDNIRAHSSDSNVIRQEGGYTYESAAATNALRLIAADAARRARLDDLSEELVAGCDNPLLRQLWNRWRKRHQLQASHRNSVDAT